MSPSLLTHHLQKLRDQRTEDQEAGRGVHSLSLGTAQPCLPPSLPTPRRGRALRELTWRTTLPQALCVPRPRRLPHGPGTTCGLDWEPHSVRAVRIEFLSRQNQLNGTHSPNTECVCVCTRVHIARKERAGARALVHPKALPGLQPTDAHSAPGSLGLDTRTRSCASGSLLGLPHGCTSSPRQQSLSPRETAPLAGS